MMSDLFISELTAFGRRVNKRSDRLINGFLLIYFVVGLVLAPLYNTWLIALGCGGLSLLAYFSIKWLLPESDLYQYVLSLVMGIFMAQFIFQMHGLFEMHFFAFIGSALLITYQKWKLQLPLAIFVVIHHSAFSLMQNAGIKGVYFTQLDYFELQTFFIHITLAVTIFFISGLWSYQFEKLNRLQIKHSLHAADSRKEGELLTERQKLTDISWMQSHLVRGPLSRILGLIPLLKEAEPDEVREIIDYIEVSSVELDTVIRTIVDHSKTECDAENMIADEPVAPIEEL
ncbi:hypothetical protein MUY27_02065 [Mucilaginibacter sp. RS28]|uniref:Histidine kinase n=1 Tax=Mucilaginibacter straminoryzae TaxID=2932774 RepID=A0A9X1X0P1_9SPHI|nr:hypothetical protein [Mucilaginibacter straminoryzae]MCJ8208476.1 hypothetical protein [Mucilaginibacter straminoryzae]